MAVRRVKNVCRRQKKGARRSGHRHDNRHLKQKRSKRSVEVSEDVDRPPSSP